MTHIIMGTEGPGSENVKPQAKVMVNELPRVSMWRPLLVKNDDRYIQHVTVNVEKT